MKKYVIWGCAGHAKVVASLIKLQGGIVAAFFDNRDVATVLPDVPVFKGVDGFHAWLKGYGDVSNVTGVVAIGGARGADRIQIQKLFSDSGLQLEPLVHPTALICNTVFLGNGSQVLGQAIVAADSVLGEVCIINHKASVDHECVLGDGVHLAPGATLCGCVHLGDNVMIGAGAVVLPRLSIGANTIVGAGAVVTKDLPEGVVVTGCPARIIRNI
ncbi:sugar acetyltransferase [Herminiimonas sp. KBW02]|uniref:acetyltransferase n=1 Tax=Herminiimonas sp. KBW02 TaxID=2153363 RepID=UPI000F593518|nr:acetyltransferase [Herminiimonas sp. KBW02]RQO36101.1 sugar acetyltransferase [Herminiimonas sp. KBW02]